MDEFKGRVAKNGSRKVKVFGERNTGTRAVMRMLRALNGVNIASPNVPMPDLDALSKTIESEMGGLHKLLYRDAIGDIRHSRLPAISAWKHAAPVVDYSYMEKAASVLFIVRDPYSWIAALYRHPYHNRAEPQDTLERFINTPWLTLARDNIAPLLVSPMLLWNEKLKAYHAFAEANPVPSTVMKFEAFVLDPVPALASALAALGIESTGLEELDEPTKFGGAGREDRRAYYRQAIWEQEISPSVAERVNALVDWELAARFGYRRRDPSSFGQ